MAPSARSLRQDLDDMHYLWREYQSLDGTSNELTLSHADEARFEAGQEVCLFAKKGKCSKYDCSYRHLLKCEYCHLWLKGQNDAAHTNACATVLHTKEPQRSLSCAICLEPVQGRRGAETTCFGLLSSCSHIYCFSCIQAWRERHAEGLYDARSSWSLHAMRPAVQCPTCRTISRRIIPCEYFTPDPVEKLLVFQSYVKSKQRFCRHQQEEDCPWGEACHFKHRQEAPVLSPSSAQSSRGCLCPEHAAESLAEQLAGLRVQGGQSRSAGSTRNQPAAPRRSAQPNRGTATSRRRASRREEEGDFMGELDDETLMAILDSLSPAEMDRVLHALQSSLVGGQAGLAADPQHPSNAHSDEEEYDEEDYDDDDDWEDEDQSSDDFYRGIGTDPVEGGDLDGFWPDTVADVIMYFDKHEDPDYYAKLAYAQECEERSYRRHGF